MQLPKITTADRDLIEAELCRRSVLYFTTKFWPVLEPGRTLVSGWPSAAISEHLEAVTKGEIRKLLITVPPGSMKSLLTRAFWPAWSWIAQLFANWFEAWTSGNATQYAIFTRFFPRTAKVFEDLVKEAML